MATLPNSDTRPPTERTVVVETDRVRSVLADRYRVERVLGEGGMATVYLAQDLRHRRGVAVKVMRPELAATVGADRFLREVEIAAQLSHPHVLPVYDSGSADGMLYYVTPYVEGESLREWMARHGQLPVDEALRLAREISEALAYAHGRGIIHRDIKPANILLQSGHALVADFGIARALGSEGVLTQTGLAVGTPHYMSPEQAMGSPEVDARADVYAVGGVLYEMLAGEPPFTGPTAQAILARSLTEEPRPLTALRPGITPAVQSVVTKAMAKSPADRYETVADLVAALTTALDVVRSGSMAAVPAGPTAGRVTGLFGVVAAGLLAVLYAVMRQLGLSPWVFALAVGLAAVGVPIMLLTRRAEQRRLAGVELRGMRRWLTWRTAIGGGVLALGLWAAVATVLVVRGAGGHPSAGVVRLAVLPFENRGAPDDAYVVDGIADQVRGKLAAVGGFQITARSSSDQYRQTTKSPQEIGRELGVDYLLSAAVSWAKGTGSAGRVQVVPELTDVRNGAVTWQDSFDADLTDVFRVQADIAVRVAGALDVALGAGDQQKLATRPTENLAAYDAFLKGEEARQSGGQTNLRQAANLYEQAVALDSTFALAWARLSQTLAGLNFSTPSPEAADGARRAVERARALAPEAPETYMALGTYYQNVAYDVARAREQYAEGLRLAPNDPGLLVGTAVTERSLGEWEQSLTLLRRAQELDPRSVGAQTALAAGLLWLRRYPEAVEEIDRGLVLAPASLTLLEDKVMTHLGQGDLDGARAALRTAPPGIEPTRLVSFLATTWDLFWVLDEGQQRLLLRLQPGSFDNDRGAWALALAATYTLRGDVANGRAYGDSARLVYEQQLDASPDDNYLLALYGLALAYAGRRDEALRAGERSVELLPVTKDAFSGAYNQHLLARSYAILGESGKAIDQLEALLAVPYYLSPGWLKIDPTWVSLRGDPRFERLVAGK